MDFIVGIVSRNLATTSNFVDDSCHGKVSGINKICFLCSSYCRSQATAALRSRVEHGDGFSSYK